MAPHLQLIGLLGLLLCTSATAQLGLTLETDASPLCAQNLAACKNICKPPKAYLYACSAGGTFSAPKQECKCVDTAPPGTVTDGMGQMQLVQYPGANFCAQNTWIFDCAKLLTIQALSNQLQGQGSPVNPMMQLPGANNLMGQQAAATPSNTAACGQYVQGIVTGASSAVITIPTFKGIAMVNTQGNDTVLISLGGANSQCVAGYKMVQGQFLNLGRQGPQPAANTTNTTTTSAAFAPTLAGSSSLCLALLLAGLFVLVTPSRV